MGKIIDMIGNSDFDTASDLLSNLIMLSNEYKNRLGKAFNDTNIEGQAIIVAVAESLSQNPEYHQDHEDVFIPPADV